MDKVYLDEFDIRVCKGQTFTIVEGIVIRGKILYLLYNDPLDNGKGDKNLYVFSIGSETGLSKEIYKKKVFFQNNQTLRFFVQMSIFSYMNIVMIMKRPVLQGLTEMAAAQF